MAHGYAKGFYASKAWHKCRDSYIKHRWGIDGGLCEECHEAAGFIVHHRRHISPKTINDPSVTLDWKNLEYVCKDCHDRLHQYCGRQMERRRKISFDDSGDPMVLPP